MRRLALITLVAIASLSTAARADFRHARMGSRPRSMGSAFVAVADDANAVYWNPAGMTLVDRFEITASRALLFAVDGLSNDYVSLTYNHPRIGGFGLSWVRLGLEDIYHEDAVNIGYARKLPFVPGLSVGACLKIFALSAPGYERYNDPAYEGRDVQPSVDIGVHYRATPALTFGAVVYNVNEPELTLLSTTKAPTPVYRETTIGVGYTFRELLLMTYDLKTRYGSFSNTIGRFGSELWFFDAVALRGGFERDNMTAGLGLKGKNWQIDVMFETHYDLGNVYQLTGTIRI